ncbi:unnamed protein product [Amoebophrya sp. A25]|nr:unnamed protein product [Amoebophrya sp. A25]|eukprot:GSA25T00014395001.1
MADLYQKHGLPAKKAALGGLLLPIQFSKLYPNLNIVAQEAGKKGGAKGAAGGSAAATAGKGASPLVCQPVPASAWQGGSVNGAAVAEQTPTPTVQATPPPAASEPSPITRAAPHEDERSVSGVADAAARISSSTWRVTDGCPLARRRKWRPPRERVHRGLL